MKKKKDKIELPDMKDWLVIDAWDIIDLYESVINKMKEILGDVPLYIVWKSYNDEYKVCETNMDNIKFMAQEYDGLKLELKKGYVYNIQNIYKNKEDAYEEMKRLNVAFIKLNIEKIQKELDAINPVKVMDEIEIKRKKLLQDYENWKAQLDSIVGKVDNTVAETDKIIEGNKGGG